MDGSDVTGLCSSSIGCCTQIDKQAVWRQRPGQGGWIRGRVIPRHAISCTRLRLDGPGRALSRRIPPVCRSGRDIGPGPRRGRGAVACGQPAG